MKQMTAKDTISGKLAKAYAIIDNQMEDMFYAKKIDAKCEVIKKELPILGRVQNEYKPSGAKNTGTMTVYYTTSRFREIMQKYVKTGITTYFTLMVENEDPSSGTGKQTVMLKEVSLDKITVALFDITADDALEEEMTFTFGDWDILDSFTNA